MGGGRPGEKPRNQAEGLTNLENPKSRKHATAGSSDVSTKTSHIANLGRIPPVSNDELEKIWMEFEES
jgi:hypothetical protein